MDAIGDLGGELAYDVFMTQPRSRGTGLLPNGEPKGGSPVASTMIFGNDDAVLTDPGFTIPQAGALGDWVAEIGRNVTDIFITHSHGDHWFAADLVAKRFRARVVASARSIVQMQVAVGARPAFWDSAYDDIPPSPLTAVSIPDNHLTLEGHDLEIVQTGNPGTRGSSVLHIPDLELVVAGDVIYNGVHPFVAESVMAGGLDPWRAAISDVEALEPRHIVSAHQNNQLDDDAERTIAETRRYLDDVDDLLQTENSAVDFFNAMIGRYPHYLGRTVLWASASTLYGVRDHPGADVVRILLAALL